MGSQYTFIHTEILLNAHTFILQYIFSGLGNEISPEKKSAPLLFLTSTLIWLLYSYTIIWYKWHFSTRPIEKNLIQLASPQTN